jgi:hypothetical protein
MPNMSQSYIITFLAQSGFVCFSYRKVQVGNGKVNYRYSFDQSLLLAVNITKFKHIVTVKNGHCYCVVAKTIADQVLKLVSYGNHEL